MIGALSLIGTPGVNDNGPHFVNFILQPWQLLVVILAGWVNRHQQQAIEYLRTENQVLKEKLGKKRILLNDDQRRRLAVKGRILGRKMLEEVGTLFTPDTIIRWHRQLVAQKWDHSSEKRTPGRPRIRQEIVKLTLKLARENPAWGCDRIQGALANVGYHISDTTVRNILKSHGIEPPPDRRSTGSWSTFLKSHWDVLAAVDFTTIEVWTRGGLVTFYLLFAMELKTRRVHFAGCTPNPDEFWMKQVARNLTDAEDGFLNGKRRVLMDRDTKFCKAFQDMLEDAGAAPLLLPSRSPNLNAYIERFFRSLKSECLSRMIFFGETSLRRSVAAYLEHYHTERNHQGVDNGIIDPGDEVGAVAGKIECRDRLGGLLRYYHRRAA